MTTQENKDIVRVAGIDYSYEDIPAYICERDDITKEDWNYAGQAEMDKVSDLENTQRTKEQIEIQAEIERDLVREVEAANELRDEQIRFIHKAIKN